jgi:hypothetical protein
MPLSAISSLEPGHAPTRPLARCSATRRSSHPRPSRTRGSSLLSMRATETSRARLVRPRSWGCALRRFDPVDGWSRRTSAAAKPLATFLSDRAHVPFVPAHPSRFIFVGMIGRRLGTSERKRRSTGDELASTSGLGSRLRSDSPAHTFGRGIDPALGFASCRVDGHESVHPLGLDPDRITSLRGLTAHLDEWPRNPQSAHGFAASFPAGMKNRREIGSEGHIPVGAGCCRREFAVPSAY